MSAARCWLYLAAKTPPNLLVLRAGVSCLAALGLCLLLGAQRSMMCTAGSLGSTFCCDSQGGFNRHLTVEPGNLLFW